MKKIEQFFCYCAGVSPTLLKRCPTETSKYVGIGGAVFFTGLLACISSAYALFFVFDNIFLAIGFGLIWGLMIFNLDRVIVTSMRKHDNDRREWIQALPRLALAILIALVMAKPLELKIFENEITTELSLMKQELLLQGEKAVTRRYINQLDSLEEEKVALDRAILEKQSKRDALLEMARQEADGTGGSGKVNPGPIYQIKKKNADLAQKELEELKLKSANRQEAIDAEMLRLSQLKLASINDLEISSINGISFQLTALDRLGEKYEMIFYANFFIVLLFIVLEAAPILVKTMSLRGPYDDLLNVHEKYFEVYRKHKTHVAEKGLEELMVSQL